jgi:hypothetical protein
MIGRATLVEQRDAKLAALFAFSEQVIPGRWNEVREPTEAELKATTVLSLPLVEVSAKVRSGPPIDDEEDYALGVWAGVLPLKIAAGAPINDPRLPEGIEPPSYTLKYSREKN